MLELPPAHIVLYVATQENLRTYKRQRWTFRVQVSESHSQLKGPAYASITV